MTMPTRCSLLVFDALHGTWIGTLEPLLSMSAHQILDDVSLLIDSQLPFVLLRTFPLSCHLPNSLNWTTVLAMVVHESPEIRSGLLPDVAPAVNVRVVAALANLGIHPSWILHDHLPDIPLALQFNWSGILRASCEPSNHAPLSFVLADFVSRMPPPRLLEYWRGLIVTVSPESPVAQEGRLTREARRNTNPYSARP